MTFTKTIIAYRPDAIAPHQGMLVDFLAGEIDERTNLIVRTIPTSTTARMAFALRVVIDALTRRGAVLYFGSFLSVVFALIPVVLLHRKWIYHSQDWITDGSGLAARLEPVIVKHAPVVIWNEPTRAEKAREEAGRKKGILVLPTYLPSDYPVPERSSSARSKIAAKLGVSESDMVILFAGGGYSHARLSDELLKASRGLDKDVVLVFTGATRVPDRLLHPNVLDLGMLDYDEMMEVMSSSDIGMLLYNYRDSFGNRYQQPGRLTEYTKGGLALIATPFSDADRLARDTEFCLTVGGYNVPELHDALQEMTLRLRTNVVQPKNIRAFAAREMAYESHARGVISEAMQALS